MSTKVEKEICLFCNKRVYIQEKVSVDSVAYHIDCFRCHKCNCKINSLSYGKIEGYFYCKTHFETIKREKMTRIHNDESLRAEAKEARALKEKIMSPRRREGETGLLSPRREEHGVSPRKELTSTHSVRDFANKYEELKNKETVKVLEKKISFDQKQTSDSEKELTPRSDEIPLVPVLTLPSTQESDLLSPKKPLTPKVSTPKQEYVSSPMSEKDTTEEEGETAPVQTILSPKNENNPEVVPNDAIGEVSGENQIKLPILQLDGEPIHHDSPEAPHDPLDVDETTHDSNDGEHDDSSQHSGPPGTPEPPHDPLGDHESSEKRRKFTELTEDLSDLDILVDTQPNDRDVKTFDSPMDTPPISMLEKPTPLGTPDTIGLLNSVQDEKKIESVIEKKQGPALQLSDKTLSILSKNEKKSTSDTWVQIKLDDDAEFLSQFGTERALIDKAPREKVKKDKSKKIVEDEEKPEEKKGKLSLLGFIKGGLIKGIVSKNKNRHVEDGFDLDLSYITPQLIAMGFPSQGIEAAYRNSMHDVIEFLEKKHKDRYMIYNLCAEKFYDSESFHGRVDNFGFEDHNPPPLMIMRPLCNNIKTWLDQDSKRVAVIHCKAGKGRTGTIMAAYLLHNGACTTAVEALDLFSKKRTRDNKGVTIPSQIRYVHYYEKCMKKGFPRKDVALTITQIKWNETPIVPFTPDFKIYILGKEIYRFKEHAELKTLESLDEQVPVYFNFRATVKSDFKIIFFNPNDAKDKYFHFWLNTNMIDGDSITLKRKDLDGVVKKDKTCKKFGAGFQISIQFERETK